MRHNFFSTARHVHDFRSHGALSHSGEKGQLIVELMVAVGVLTAGFGGIFALMNRSLSLNRTVSNNYIGTYLAMEGIEVVKNILDANALQSGVAWNAGFADGAYEVDYNSTALQPNQNRFLRFDSLLAKRYNYLLGTVTPFKRTVIITLKGANELTVNSVVAWAAKGDFRVELEDHFFNWRFP